MQSSYWKHVQLPWDTCLMFDICLDDPFFSMSLSQVRIYYMFVFIQVAPNHPSPYPIVFSFCWLLVFYFRCFTFAVPLPPSPLSPSAVLPPYHSCTNTFVQASVYF